MADWKGEGRESGVALFTALPCPVLECLQNAPPPSHTVSDQKLEL